MVSMNDKCAGGTGAVIDKIASKLQIAEAVARRDALPRAQGLPDCRQVRRVRRDRHQRPPEAGRARRGTDGLAVRRHRPAEPDRALARAHAAARRPAARRPARVHPGPARGVADAASPSAGRSGEPSSPPARRPKPRSSRPRWPSTSAPWAAWSSHGATATRPPTSSGRTAWPRPSRAATRDIAGAPPRWACRAPTSRSSASSTSGRHGHPPVLERGSHVRGFIGLDAGSTSTKAVLLDEDGRVLAKAYQLSRGNPIEDAKEMFAALRTADRVPGRDRRRGRPRDDGVRQGHPEGRLLGRRRAGRDGGPRQVRPAFLRRPARDRRRRRPGHQDHRDARRPGEGLPAQHPVLGGQRLFPAGHRQELRLPGGGVRRGRLLGARDAGVRLRLRAVPAVGDRQRPAAGLEAAGDPRGPRLGAAEERLPLRGEGAEPVAVRVALRAAGRHPAEPRGGQGAGRLHP